MNKFSGVGYIVFKPKLEKNNVSGEIFTKFQVAFENNLSRYKQISSFVVNCIAYGEIAEYIFRNCSKGVLVELSGSVCSQSKPAKKDKEFILTFICVNELKALTKREIKIADIEEYVGTYEKALTRRKILELKKENKEENGNEE